MFISHLCYDFSRHSPDAATLTLLAREVSTFPTYGNSLPADPCLEAGVGAGSLLAQASVRSKRSISESCEACGIWIPSFFKLWVSLHQFFCYHLLGCGVGWSYFYHKIFFLLCSNLEMETEVLKRMRLITTLCARDKTDMASGPLECTLQKAGVQAQHGQHHPRIHSGREKDLVSAEWW